MNKYAGLGLGDLSWAGMLATGGVGALGGFVIDRYLRKKKDLTSNLLWGAGGFGAGALGSAAWQIAAKAIADRKAKDKEFIEAKDPKSKAPKSDDPRMDALRRTHPGKSETELREIRSAQDKDTGLQDTGYKREWDLRPGKFTIGLSTVGAVKNAPAAMKDIDQAVMTAATEADKAQKGYHKSVQAVENAAKAGKSLADPSEFGLKPDQLRVVGADERVVEVGRDKYVVPRDADVYVDSTGVKISENTRGKGYQPVKNAKGRVTHVEKPGEATFIDPNRQATQSVKTRPIKPESHRKVIVDGGKVVQKGTGGTAFSTQAKTRIGLSSLQGAGKLARGAAKWGAVGYGLDVLTNNIDRIMDYGKKLARESLNAAKHGAKEIGQSAGEGFDKGLEKLRPSY